MKPWHGYLLILLMVTACSRPGGSGYEEELEFSMESPDTVVRIHPSASSFSKESNSDVSHPRRNLILMIADGGGFGTFYSAADFLTGSPTGFSFQQPDWTFVSCTTHHAQSHYDPERDWTDFQQLLVGIPDSASTATALQTGVKTLNERVNRDVDGKLLTPLAFMARKRGMSVGFVTTTEIADATPSALVGNAMSRKYGSVLFSQMLYDGMLEVMLGIGKPNQKKGRLARLGPSPADWEKLLSGELPPGWVFMKDGQDLKSYLSGKKPLPEKLVGIFPDILPPPLFPREASLEENSPTLSELTGLLFSMLQRNEAGFYALIENGQVDQANHTNDLKRCMEEMAEFHRTVEWVCAWVEKHSSWEETLLIVTADHDTGAFMGETLDANGLPTSAPQFQGRGKLPLGKYYSGDHSRMLVPVYARGRGAEKLRQEIRGTDPYMGKYWNYDGKYIDNTDIFSVMRAVLTP